MGTSTAGGYVNAEGNITSWINELAFVPLDYNPRAATDEWSGDYGCNVQYFSQQAVGRLLAPAGIPWSDTGDSENPSRGSRCLHATKAPWASANARAAASSPQWHGTTAAPRPTATSTQVEKESTSTTTTHRHPGPTASNPRRPQSNRTR